MSCTGKPVVWRRWLALGALVVACTVPARATIILGSMTWDDANKGLMGWQSAYYGTNQLSRQAPGGHPAGWLDISFGTNLYDLISTPATNLFAGTWTPDMVVKFDFWASNKAPSQLAVRWKSLTNSYVWSHSLSVASTQTWSTLTASFSDWNDWALGPGATEDMFLADLASINWIGIYIGRNGAGPQEYGLDNFNLMVPEPSEYTMLAAALVGGWIFLRRRHRALPR